MAHNDNNNIGDVVHLIRDSISDAKEMARESKLNSKEALDVARKALDVAHKALAVAERNSNRHDEFSQHLTELVEQLEDLSIKIVGDPSIELKLAVVEKEKKKGKMWAALAGFFTAAGVALGALAKYVVDLLKSSN